MLELNGVDEGVGAGARGWVRHRRAENKAIVMSGVVEECSRRGSLRRQLQQRC